MRARVTGTDELRELARALRRQADGRTRQRELATGLRGAARPLVPIIRTNIKSLPSRGESKRRGRKSLRTEMAGTVTLEVRTSGRSAGVSVFINPRKMPDGKKSLPGYFEGVPGKLLLRHPVFKRPDRPAPWVLQSTPSAGFFTRSIGPAAERAVREAQAVIERMAREIEG